MQQLPGDVQRYIFQYAPKESRILSKNVSQTTNRAFYNTSCQSEIGTNELNKYLETEPYVYLSWEEEDPIRFENQLHPTVFNSINRHKHTYYSDDTLISVNMDELAIDYDRGWFRDEWPVDAELLPSPKPYIIDLVSASNIYKKRKNCQRIGLSLGKSYVNTIVLKYLQNVKSVLLNATLIPELNLCNYHCYLLFNCDYLQLKRFLTFQQILIPFKNLEIDDITQEITSYSFTRQAIEKLDEIKSEITQMESLIIDEFTI